MNGAKLDLLSSVHENSSGVSHGGGAAAQLKKDE